jgi:hypothetical protein
MQLTSRSSADGGDPPRLGGRTWPGRHLSAGQERVAGDA